MRLKIKSKTEILTPKILPLPTAFMFYKEFYIFPLPFFQLSNIVIVVSLNSQRYIHIQHQANTLSHNSLSEYYSECTGNLEGFKPIGDKYNFETVCKNENA